MHSLLESTLESALRSLSAAVCGGSESRIPGPGLPLLGDLPTAAKWMLENRDKLPMHRSLELHARYGDVYAFSVGPAEFVVAGGQSEFRRVLTHEDFQQHVDLPFLRKFGASRGLFMATGQTWKQHRRFGHRALRDLGFGKVGMESAIEEEAEHLVASIGADCSRALAAQPTMAKAVSNVINRLVFGRRFEFDDAEFASHLEHTRMVTNISLTLVFLPLMLPWLEATPGLLGRLPGSNTFAQGYAFIKEFCMRQVQLHKSRSQSVDCNNNSSVGEEEEQQRDFIDMFLEKQQRLREESSPEAEFFTDEDLCDIVADFFVAGTDTTAVALTWALLLAATHQEAQDKLRNELFPLRHCRVWEQQQRLHYSRAFIDETLRHCVLTPINFRSALRDTTVGSFAVAAGTVVGANAFAVSRDPRLFPQPELFRPERFLDADGCYRRDPALDGVAFGAGRRGCMGESLARAELLIFLSRLVQNFQVELPEDERPRLSQIFTGEDGAVHQPAAHRLLFSRLAAD